MKLAGSIQGHELLVLIDSGSSHSFLSQKIANLLATVSPVASPMLV